MLSFIRNLVGVKADQAVQGAVEALVRFDPKSATEAELRTMEEHLDRLGLRVAEARAAYDKEQREAVEIERLAQQRMAAAEQLQKQMEAATDPAAKAAVERSLGTLIGLLEQMAPDIERERRDAVEAREFLEMIESSYAQAGQKLRGARADLDKAQRDMSRAEQQRDMAQQRAEAARQAAGLSSATSGLSVALKAMQDTAQRNLAEAEAASAKAKLLAPTKPEVDDPHIAAAMRQVTGQGAVSGSLSDRLAALRQPQGSGGFLPAR